MGEAVDVRLLLAYGAGIVFLFFVGRVLVLPMKIILKLVYNAILGGIALLLINLVGGLFGFKIAFNLITAFVTGFLGVPGVVLIVILTQILGV